ncbi:hypothetical protein pb186bvf_011860 [Paramecium bursaria]
MRNKSFELIKQTQYPHRFREQSCYCQECGPKTKKFCDNQYIIHEIPMIRKERMANLIINNLKSQEGKFQVKSNKYILIQRAKEYFSSRQDSLHSSFHGEPTKIEDTPTSCRSSQFKILKHSMHSQSQFKEFKVKTQSGHIKNNSLGNVHRLYLKQIPLVPFKQK